jgi:hypothetical protein
MAFDSEDRHWQPPARDEKPSDKMAWLNDVVSMGESYNSTLLSARDIGKAISMISGAGERRLTQSRSDLTMNREKRALREVVANIADIRAVDCYTSDNPAYQDFLGMMNKVGKAVWFESRFPSAFKKACQWLVAGGYSFISPVYRNIRLQSKSARRIDFDVYSCNDALPFQVPDNNSVQGVYAWTRIRFMPEYEAHAKFPKFQSKLRPVARRRYSGNAAKDRIGLAERFRAGAALGTASNWAAEMDEIRYTTVRDLSLNDTKKPIPMGKPGALESYIVPFLGQELPTAQFIQPGIRKTRKATEEDCFLYPNLRLFVSQTGMDTPIYDGPFWDWHGMHPLARFSADEWPWEPGYSLAADIEYLANARRDLLRGMDQTARARFDPAILYNKDAGLNRKTMEKFDPYEERGRLGVDGPVDEKLLRTALPDALLSIQDWAFKYEQGLMDGEDYMLGLNALNNLAKAKIASADSAVEKAQEEAGPIATDISHGMEEPMAEIMEMVLALVMQYYPTGRIMQYVGPDGVAKEVFDLKPESLVPSHGQDEDPENGPSIYTRMDLVKTFLANIHAQITPGSLHGEVQTKQKLLMLQLQRSGFMISSETVAKSMDLANWGTLEGNTEVEKWQSEQRMKLEFAEKLKQLATSLQPQGASGPPQPAQMGGNAGKPGRPPTGNKPANMKTKGSGEGQRVAITH